MRNLNCDDTSDRLSELPDSLILEILSLMAMRDVVRTTLLSKRWKDLWTTIPNLDFDKESGKNPARTRAFINGALQRWKGTKLVKFTINFCRGIHDTLYHDLGSWVHFAMEREVEELQFYLPYDYSKPHNNQPVYSQPKCLYSCSSITKLWLIGNTLQTGMHMQWDRLKNLMIHHHSLGDELINQILSSAPKLEIFDLNVYGSYRRWSLSFRSSSLKKLSLKNYVHYDNPSVYTVLTILASKLESLTISGYAYTKCLIDVPSLTNATFFFDDIWDELVGETLKQILLTIQNVEAVTLSPCVFKMLGVMQAKYSFSPLLNVKILKFSGPIKPNEIVGLVEIFPKVEKLAIYWTLANLNLYQKKYVKSEAKKLESFLTELRTVEITWYSYETEIASIFQFIEFLLKHATMVQKLVIYQGGEEAFESKTMAVAAQGLQSLQRSFPTIDMNFCQFPFVN